MLRTTLAEASGQDSLVLEHMHIGDAEAEQICKYLAMSSRSLQTLRIRNCRISKAVFLEILSQINTSIESLTTLDLSHTNVLEVLAELFRFVTSTHTLTELNLTGCGLSLQAALTGEALATLISQHQALLRVSLEKNAFDVKIGNLLADAVSRNPRILEVRLAGSGVGISNLNRIHSLLTKNYQLKYPALASADLPLVDKASLTVFSEEAVVEWITLRRAQFAERIEERRLLALRYEASVIHDTWLASRSREKFDSIRAEFLEREQMELKRIKEMIDNLKSNEFPKHTKTMDELYKKQAVAELRMDELERARAMEEAEQAVKESKDRHLEELRVQDADQEKMIDWVVQQELATITALEAEIVEIKRRIAKKRQITHLLFN